MPVGQSSSIRRWMGLALSRQLLRRSLALQGAAGTAMLWTVIASPRPEAQGAGLPCRLPAAAARAGSAKSVMSNESLSFKG